MVPVPEEFTYEYWLTGPTNYTCLTCLMPYGVCILLKNVHHNATLAEIKEVRRGLLHEQGEMVVLNPPRFVVLFLECGPLSKSLITDACTTVNNFVYVGARLFSLP